MTKHVLMFDSGVGGLSVLQACRVHNPHYQYSYLFDNLYFPYGELSENTLLERVSTLLVHAVAQLKPDLLVVACNTASTATLPRLRALLSIPVVGVVPAIKPAALLSKQRHIGLLATPATIKRNYTDALIKEFAADCRIEHLGSTRLVELAEAKLAGESLDFNAEVAHVLKPWQSLTTLDAVVLGCTHFPLLRDEISRALGERVSCVDSGEAIARRVRHLLGDTPITTSFYIRSYATKALNEKALNETLQGLGIEAVELLA